jgi:adenylate cyclase
MPDGMSVGGLANETGWPPDRLAWLRTIGLLRPDDSSRFTAADVFRVRMVSALVEAGFADREIERAAAEGGLNFDHIDAFLLADRGPRSDRSFAEFAASLGAAGALLPRIMEVLGMTPPPAAEPLHVGEERLLGDFLAGWSVDPDGETPLRAARLIGDGSRLIALGWSDLLEDRVGAPARDRLMRGEADRFSPEVARTIAGLVALAPRMMTWIFQAAIERRATEGIVDGFERFLASRGRAPQPDPPPPPAVVFVDLSEFTRRTESEGDEAAVRSAAVLQREADVAAAANGGRVVKLLGDGAMLRLPDASSGIEAALALVRSLTVALGQAAHAGIHVGPVIERDRDLFGRTVNLAARISGAAGPGEVLVSEATRSAAENVPVRFERRGTEHLKGIPEPVELFLVSDR